MSIEDYYKKVVDLFSPKADYDFDSHEFTKILEMVCPTVYYRTLLQYIPENQVKLAYQLHHAKIGRDLSRLKDNLDIQCEGKHLSPNYREGETENAKWKKKYMATIKCPDCGRRISDKSSRCPNCGCPTTIAVKHHKRNMIITLLVIAILGIFAICEKLDESKNGRKTQTKTEQNVVGHGNSANTDQSSAKVKNIGVSNSQSDNQQEEVASSLEEGDRDNTSSGAKTDYNSQFDELKQMVNESVKQKATDEKSSEDSQGD